MDNVGGVFGGVLGSVRHFQEDFAAWQQCACGAAAQHYDRGFAYESERLMFYDFLYL